MRDAWADMYDLFAAVAIIVGIIWFMFKKPTE